MTVIPATVLPTGETIPALGIGTWNMGDTQKTRADEIAALRLAVDLGMTVVDTAEMYGDGAAEELARARAARRNPRGLRTPRARWKDPAEYDLLPWCRAHSVPVMAYSPLEQGRLTGRKALHAVAARLGATPAQVALAWVLRQPGVIAIFKSGRPERVRENRGALDIELARDDLAELDEAFAPPARKIALEMI